MARLYDLTDENYKLFVEDTYGKQYRAVSTDLKNFDVEPYPYNFSIASKLPKDAQSALSLGITKAESDKILKKFTNPSVRSINFTKPGDITVEKSSDIRAELDKLTSTAEIVYEYNDGEGYKSSKAYNYGIHWNNSELAVLESAPRGEYTLHGYIGGDSYYVLTKAASRIETSITADEALTQYVESLGGSIGDNYATSKGLITIK